MNTLFVGFACGLGGYAAYRLFTSALSDTLGLKTLRHGTGPCNFLSIQVNGALPKLGGKAAGESTLRNYSEYSDHTENKFFVWNDDFHQQGLAEHPLTGLLNCKPLHPLVKRLGGRYYCIQGGIAAATFKNVPAIGRVPLQILGGIAGTMTPIIDFHTTPEKFEKNFTVDEFLVPVARYTSKPLKSWKYIGLKGVFYQGFNKEVFSRIKKDPSRLIKGLAKMLLLTTLILSILSVISTYSHINGLINIYSLITHATSSGHLLLPLTVGGGIALPLVSLVAT